MTADRRFTARFSTPNQYSLRGSVNSQVFDSFLPCKSLLPSPSIWALSRSIHATSFDATVAVPGEIYSRAMNSLPHRN